MQSIPRGVVQAAGLQPAPVASDAMQKKEVAALKEQLSKLLSDLEARSCELHSASRAHADLKEVLQQSAEAQSAAELSLNAQIAGLRSELELKARELLAESQNRAELESALKVASERESAAQEQPGTALQLEGEASRGGVQALEAELAGKSQDLAAAQHDLAQKQQELAGVWRQLEGKQSELEAASQAYVELEEVLARASEEQSASEDKLIARMTALQDEVKVSSKGPGSSGHS